jgi:hypothetical protein
MPNASGATSTRPLLFARIPFRLLRMLRHLLLELPNAPLLILELTPTCIKNGARNLKRGFGLMKSNAVLPSAILRAGCPCLAPTYLLCTLLRSRIRPTVATGNLTPPKDTWARALAYKLMERTKGRSESLTLQVVENSDWKLPRMMTAPLL